MLIKKWVLTGAMSCLLICTAGSTLADTAVWKVTKDGSTVFLGGTIHVLSADDYPLPHAFEEAYKKSEVVFFEVDIADLSSREFIASFGRKSSYPLGTTLEGQLSKETWSRFEAYMSSIGLSAASVNHLRPGAVMSTLMTLELMKLGVVAEGVDHHFYNRSFEDQKLTGSFETAEQQIQLITDLGKGNEDEFIQYLIDDMQNLAIQFGQMKEAWLHGNNLLLGDVSQIGEMKKQDPSTYRSLLENRNRLWLPVIEKMFDTQAVEFVLVGALHMVGEDGLLKLLADKNYQIKQLQDH